jgi:hypothetical protein
MDAPTEESGLEINNALIWPRPFSWRGCRRMAERKSRKNVPDMEDLDDPTRFVLTEPEPVELASGYSIAVEYDKNGRPLIYVKKYGNVDTQGLRRNIERSYPGASIQGLEKPRMIGIEREQREKLKTPRRSGRRKTSSKREKRSPRS